MMSDGKNPETRQCSVAVLEPNLSQLDDCIISTDGSIGSEVRRWTVDEEKCFVIECMYKRTQSRNSA